MLHIYNSLFIAAKLRRWEKYLNRFCLPLWDELPDFEIYMDQLISLTANILDLFPHDAGSDPLVTPSTINNYVRMKIMPAPVKKKYSRIHLAYLIIICTLKQSLSISVVSKIIPMNITEDEAREIYDDFVTRHRSLCRQYTEQVKQLAAGVFNPECRDDAPVKGLVVEAAIYSHLYKLLTEKIVALNIDPAAGNKN